MTITTDLHRYFRNIECDIAHERGRLALYLDNYLAPIGRGRLDDLIIDLISATIAATLSGAGIELTDDSEGGSRGDLLH